MKTPINREQSLKPVSAHCTSTVVLSKSVRKRKIKYTFSITFAGFVKLNQSSESKIDLTKMLKTPKKIPTIIKLKII